MADILTEHDKEGTEYKDEGDRKESEQKVEEEREDKDIVLLQGSGTLLPFHLGSGHVVSKSGYRLFRQACPEEFECCICFEMFRVGQRVAFHPVASRPDRIHVFHFECITHWVWKGSHDIGQSGWSTNGCPVCLHPFEATSSMSDVRRARTNEKRFRRKKQDKETRNRLRDASSFSSTSLTLLK